MIKDDSATLNKARDLKSRLNISLTNENRGLDDLFTGSIDIHSLGTS